ncbi:MAG: ABC transporter permease [Myxococcota bacterium]
MSASTATIAESTPPPAVATIARPTRARAELGLVLALWQRDLLRFRKDTGRWVGVVLQPVLLWVVLGTGMGKVFGPDYHRYFFPGLVAMIALFTAIFATMAVIEDRQKGFLQQVLVAPGSKTALVVGKVLGVLSIALIQLALTLPAAPLAGFDLLAVDWPLFIAAFVLGTTVVTAASFALAWVVSSTHAYHALMGVLLIPLWLVSGAVFPLSGTGWLGTLALANPITYMVDGMRHALDGGASALGHASSAASLGALLAFAAATLALASLVARKPVGAPE